MLEIIITGRNDDFGGQDFNDRWCAAAEHNHRLLTAFGVDHRFTMVEWNPIEGRPLLAEIIKGRLPWFHRAIVVDREWHHALSTNPRLQFMEFFGKNAAIRRSDADLILTTNSDVFLSTDVARALAGGLSDDRAVYRAVRYDIDRNVDWRRCGEEIFADAQHHVRVNDLQPPDYGNSSGDFLLLTRNAWMALGGFNERVRFAKIHKDGQFCVNARLEGYRFEVLGPIWHIDHDGSYANAGEKRHAPDQPYGPQWNYNTRYRNAASWGLSTGIDETPGNGIIHVHHPSTHGRLLSAIVPKAENVGSTVNTGLVTACTKFIAVAADPTLPEFGGHDALVATLESTTASLIAPRGSLVQHPTLGLVPAAGAPFVMRRSVVDALIDWDETDPDPALAFWLRAADSHEIAEAGPAPAGSCSFPRHIPAVLEVATLVRRGVPVPVTVVEKAIAEGLQATSDLRGLVARWIDLVAPNTERPCAIVGPDWATPYLIEAVVSCGRPLAGVFTAVASEEGTGRWGETLRPISQLANVPVSYVLTGADTRIEDRLLEVGCHAPVQVIVRAEELNYASADAELDGLRRAQARDLATPNITRVLARLPLLSLLEGERGWSHRYDAAIACDKAGRATTALELFQDIVAECATDPALAGRAAYHTARLLVERGAYQKAAPLLHKIVKNNPGHKAARQLLEQITQGELTV
jgi:hypothetical protein